MSANRFVVRDRGEWPVRKPGTFTLIRDLWDDYHFKTSFNLHYATVDEVIEFGAVKIARIGTAEHEGPTALPSAFSELDEDYFSLGQSREYYEQISTLPEGQQKEVLRALRDVAADPAAYIRARNEPAFTVSMLRSIPERTVVTQFRRMTRGEPALTAYEYTFTQPRGNAGGNSLTLAFCVDPESAIPTNTHVLIGANGVGKSRILRNLAVDAAQEIPGPKAVGETAVVAAPSPNAFVNVIHLSFSAFDQTPLPQMAPSTVGVHQIGLVGKHRFLEEQFVESLQACVHSRRLDRWHRAIDMLEHADALLADESARTLVMRDGGSSSDTLATWFGHLSSGHKIAILTVTKLVELVEERSLILIDEPETHLHPPLLSALIRAITDLAVKRNGVAVVATHSPIVLQEVPQSCVWVISRVGYDVRADRLQIESFGESVSRLTTEVFHLDVTHTGYHSVISDLLRDNYWNATETLKAIGGRIGEEGRLVLHSMAFQGGREIV